ncbi:hemolysin D [Massilia eurypsychrophila]|uniref:Membrane fusion protein (MFP) family protein n=1 Tax=Massilia eurypsychrophila TaxID=1485217 RepID=A0A2G8TFI1_9BURK|nr:HlyD family type I secretion periplasmic adaptor subunit [Massilia eurypsychrophila]PIL44408.1 hemolysin D [Massilia eurypsychrophila]
MNLVKKQTDVAEVVTHEVTPVTVNTDASAYSRFGWIIVLVGFGGFLLWALFAPLDKGVPLSGVVTSESNRQAVQHQAGGTVRQLLVQEGSAVKAGQVLVKMNPVTAQSQTDISRGQYMTARATEARLIAERDGAGKVVFPADLLAQKGDPRAQEVMSLQSQLFSSRQMSLQNELASYDQNIAGLKVQASSTRESLESKKIQAGLLKEQLAGMRDLAREGYVARNKLLELERIYAQLNGAISEDIGMIGKIQHQVTEFTLRRSQKAQDYQKEVRTVLTDIQKEAEALSSRMDAQNYELANVDVKAPADGVVVGLNVFTNGGVVPPGFRMMDIVPSGAPLVVEGQLPVNLVDRVHVGLPVELMFSAFNVNKTPHIPGEVVNVAADRTVEERTGFAYYKVRVKVTPAGAALVAKHKMAIQSGMPVDLFVKTGERTMMNYLLKPIFDRANSSLSEE